ncbi:MAG: type V CRISPR-associated protein Cas12b [Pirellulaceae bacterium]
MQWSSAKVKKFLMEGCQLYGLHLREVLANYTSRQCSRTGLPGIRCDDVPADEFLSAPWWDKAIKSARKKVEDKKSTDSEANYLVDLYETLSKVPDHHRKRLTVRVPRPGGDLFVAAPSSAGGGTPSKVLQADLNAAANIGLRALLDPDFPARWWYVPCATADAKIVVDKVKGSACFGKAPEQLGTLRSSKTESDAPATKKRRAGRANQASRNSAKSKEVTNYWSDPKCVELAPAPRGFWLETTAYWRWVRKRVINGILRKFNRVRESDTGKKNSLEPDE